MQLTNKQGEGVRATVDILGEDGKKVGSLTFHEGRDWQVTDSSRADKLGWEPFEAGLRLARDQYPKG